MKVSEAIDQLEIGDTVWAKATVNAINFEGGYIRAENTETSIYLDGNAEISLEEPREDKVVVPDFVAEWYETHKDDLEYNIWCLIIKSSKEYEDYESNKTDMRYWIQYAPNHPIETLIRMKDGYTVKPKRWVIKNTDGDTCYLKRFRIGDDCIDGESSGWIGERVWAFTFDDRDKADVVALLVEGSVEEV